MELFNEFKDYNIEYLLNNYENISRLKQILIDNDEGAQYLSLLVSLINSKEKNYTFHTPIYFDATCSGMQHLSALFADVDLAKMSNVIGNLEEIL
jgi:hypothetical protein